MRGAAGSPPAPAAPGERARAGLGTALCALLAACGGRPSEAPAPVAERLAADERIAALLQPCPRDEFYERDLSDPVPILLEKLERGEREPLSRAVEELGLLGERSLEPLARALERVVADPRSVGLANHLVGALALNPAQGSSEALLVALDHPHENVRQAAYRAFGGARARPEHYDAFYGRVWLERGPTARLALGALAAADPPRFRARALEWALEREPWAVEDVVRLALAKIADPERLDVLAARAEELPSSARPFGLAALAAAGRPGFAERFDAELARPAAEERFAALVAAAEAGLLEPLFVSLRADPDPVLRQQVAGVLGGVGAKHPGSRAALGAALADGDPRVRSAARAALAALGDEEVLDGLLARLVDARWEELREVLQVLRPHLVADSDLAERALFFARRRYELERHLPAAQRAQGLMALGMVPTPTSARLLLEAAGELEGETIEGLDGHRWACLHAGNTGAGGRALLAEALDAERHPIRRLDLLFAVASERDALAFDVLAERTADPEAQPLERLHAASLWIRQGPSWEVAPRLRRLALEFTGEPRRALNCLLWHWY